MIMTSDILYPKPLDAVEVSYGTAGFRMSYDACPARLESVVYRMGVLSALRSKSQNAVIGLMITASHNPESDNGVKIVDPLGEMLISEWEEYATKIANCPDDLLISKATAIANEHSKADDKSKVVVGRDTRRSSTRLVEAAVAGVKLMGVVVEDCGILTTPQLHFLVRECNTRTQPQDCQAAYISRFTSESFVTQLKQFRPSNYSSKLHVDCANGVGSVAINALTSIVHDGGLHIVTRNQWNGETSSSAGPLNEKCGADYVKLRITAPKVYDGPSPSVGERWASLDGDADRVVYFFLEAAKGSEHFVLLDGDRLATLFASFFNDLLEEARLIDKLSLGLVQTAYANGESTRYITEKLHLPVSCVPTGVKYLHAEASHRFDIGIYFEANGHGTVIFSEKARAMVNDAATGGDQKAVPAIRHLAGVMGLVNEAIGDAITDMLLVEHILACRGWDLSTWVSQYTDLPVCQLKVAVKDRTAVQTEDAERRCVAPDGLQAAVDRLVADVPAGRAFVRPSGTEDVVRVYAECQGEAEDALRLATAVACEVYDIVDGVGERPTPK